MPNEKETPLTVQFLPKLGRSGLFAIKAKVERVAGVFTEETVLTLRPDQAIGLGGLLVSEGKKYVALPSS